MKLAEYLGSHVSELLGSDPFSAWPVERSTEDDRPGAEVWYEFRGAGVEVICDEDESVRSIFLHAYGHAVLPEVPFSLTRRQVSNVLGRPSASGITKRHPVLGEPIAWDRFDGESCCIHVQYRRDADEIDMITLIRPDAIP